MLGFIHRLPSETERLYAEIGVSLTQNSAHFRTHVAWMSQIVGTDQENLTKILEPPSRTPKTDDINQLVYNPKLLMNLPI